MDKNIDRIQKIDSYLQGDLRPEEVDAFENQLKHDPELHANLVSTQSVIEGLRGYAFKEKLSTFHDEYVTTKKNKTVRLYYLSGIAASLALIIISYFYWSPDSSTRYYSYFVPYASPVNVRSGNESNISQTAFEHYERGEYDQAIADFEKLNAKALTEEIQFYKGISYLATHNPKAATTILIKLKGVQYHEQVNWYLSLCYLVVNEKDQARALLKKIQPGEYGFDQARELLNTL